MLGPFALAFALGAGQITAAAFHLEMEKIGQDFFERDPVACARELIGCMFVWKGCSGRIVETEAYRAVGDEACHTWVRPSARKFVADHKAGIAYVYVNYGVHWLFNILVKGPEEEGFVLIRALEPIKGVTEMMNRRGEMKHHQLASGPGKLTRALGLDGSAHGCDFLGLEDSGIFRGESDEIIAGPRIGISKAVDLPWRFGEMTSTCLSRRF